MTLIAGIISRNSNRPLPEAVCDSLRQSISRDPRDEVSIYEDERSYFVKVDIGAFGEPAEKRDENGAITLLTGEPLLDGENTEQDTAFIHDGFIGDDLSIFAQS